MRVHLVEDDPGVSDSLGLLLRDLGHEVIAHAGVESVIGTDPPAARDAVIVDLGLPGIGGAHLVRWLQSLAMPPRIIVISGQSQTAIESQLRGMPRPVLIRKPLDERALTVALVA